MDEVRYYAGLKATWGGPNPPSFQLQGSVSTKDLLSVTVGYDFTPRKQKPQPTVEGLTRDRVYVSAQEGGPIRQWRCKSVCQPSDSPSKTPKKFREVQDE
jgi:hypothetical protein